MTYNACDCIGPVQDCSWRMGGFVNAIKYVEHIRLAIPQESKEAPGRLRDRFQFLVKHLDNVIPQDEARNQALLLITERAIKEIDRVRDEMMAAKTKYIPHNLQGALRQVVDEIQARLMVDAIAEMNDCICPGR